ERGEQGEGDIKVEWINIEVPIVICELQSKEWKPKTQKTIIQVIKTNTGDESLKILNEYQ
ncbi:hypothetical protein, partial [Tolypothrix sp. VBCCA 56010]|uniref:hypothetical protein n=1 Tax=Tolypothrix sp. VBCCA 56010 TaxID=3137731 RepID=UPI003D7F0C0F